MISKGYKKRSVYVTLIVVASSDLQRLVLPLERKCHGEGDVVGEGMSLGEGMSETPREKLLSRVTHMHQGLNAIEILNWIIMAV